MCDSYLIALILLGKIYDFFLRFTTVMIINKKLASHIMFIKKSKNNQKIVLITRKRKEKKEFVVAKLKIVNTKH